MVNIVENMRWKDYFLRKGIDFQDFWRSYLTKQNRNICYILGLGFDPRMCSAISFIMSCNGDGLRDCYLIRYDEGEDSPSKKYEPEIRSNFGILSDLFNNKGTIIPKDITMVSKDRRRIGGRNAMTLFDDVDIAKYSDVIIDISALPRQLYFPIIKRFLYYYDSSRLPINIHVIVVENPKLDSIIKALGVEDKADYIAGFHGEVELESTGDMPKIWIPILGEGKTLQIKTIHTLIDPKEICPLLPFPATNPRRGDDIIIEYRELLFDQLKVEPENILYASEQNPFDVYRKIIRTISQYYFTFRILGGCKFIISILSSKLLSLGALLVVYDISEKFGTEIPIGVTHVENQGYELVSNPEELKGYEEFYSLWIAGECYDN